MRRVSTGRVSNLLVACCCAVLCYAANAQNSPDLADPVSTSLVIVNGFLVFFMQVGFLAYETGSGRAKNVRNILLKNLLDVMLAALVWWAVGYAFAYGNSAAGVIGTDQFFYEGGLTFKRATRPWFFSWTFCIAACTIISGCLAERTALTAYPAATLVISGIVHPLLVHWIWSPEGWLSHFSHCPVLDFAGGTVVHMLGGLFGLVGAWRCGPRLGRFEMLSADEHYDMETPPGEAGTKDSASELAEGDAAAAQAAGASVLTAAASGHQEVQSWTMASAADATQDGVATHTKGDATVQQAAIDGGFTYSGATGLHLLGTVAAASTVPAPGITAGTAAASPNRSDNSGQGVRSGLQSVRLVKAMRRHRHKTAAAGKIVGSAAAAWRRKRSALAQCTGPHQVSKAMPGHDMAFVTLGTFMLWFGWFGFNSGSVYMYVSGSPSSLGGLSSAVSAEVVQRASMNTALGGASGGLAALLVAAICSGTYDLRMCCNGVLSGLVTVTCMCGFVDPWAAVVCSGIAGALYPAMSALLLRAGVDDPLDSSAVHLGNGMLGMLMLAFVAKPQHVAALTGSGCGGVFYTSSGWLQLGLQVLGIIVVIAVAGGAAVALFEVLGRLRLLRVDQVTELAGIDNVDHGGPAYPEAASNSFSATARRGALPGRRVL